MPLQACDAIVALAGRVDGLLLDLHGAMTTKTYDDGEGELLRRIRQHVLSFPSRSRTCTPTLPSKWFLTAMF